MKTRLLATGVMLAIASVALGQGHPPGPPPMYSIDKLEILLDLDAYQKQEVQKILDAQREAMRAKHEQLRASDTRPSFEEMQKERAAADAATREKLQKVLNEQQLKKFDVLSERPAMHRRGRESENK